MEQATLDRIEFLIRQKRDTETELASLITGAPVTEKPPRKPWTKRTKQTEDPTPPAQPDTIETT
jgi:hypothetical protein